MRKAFQSYAILPAIALPLALLTACGSGGTEEAASGGQAAAAPTEADIKLAAELTPSNPELAAKYDRSCRSCHAEPSSTAPLTGHKSAWATRFEAKGANGLLTSSKAGIGAMPAMGLCNDCTDEEFNQLIAFMAGKEK